MISEITDRKNTKNDDIKKIKINDRTINTCENPQLVSNTFNEFFTNVGKNLSNNIEISTMAYKKDVFSVSFNQFFTESICESDVLKVINNLKDETAAGFDGISVKIIKSVAIKIISPLAHIYNLSIKNIIFPEKLKVAVIKPLFKNGDKTCINNYRPISMLNNFSKIFEKVVKNRLILFLEKFELLSKNQFAFRPGLGTENALYNVTRFINSALDENKKVMAIFLDLSKAFDTVNHTELLNILPEFGINSLSFDWFKSYLDDRRQMTDDG